MSFGLSFRSTIAYKYISLLFEADHSRVIEELTDPRGYHERTNAHPIFVLVFNTPGRALTALTRSSATAAVILNSFFGALAIVFAERFFVARGMDGKRAIAFAVVLGLSATHLVFGSTPETWVFAAFGIILLFYLAVKKPGKWGWFLPAGVFAAGMVTTNLIPTAIAFGAGLFGRRRARGVIIRVVAFVAAITGILVALAFLQKQFYPTAGLFFAPSTFAYELNHYVPIYVHRNDYGTGDYFVRALQTIGYTLLFNVVAPAIKVAWRSVGEYCLPLGPAVAVDPPRFSPIGYAAAAAWLSALLYGAFVIIRRRLWRDNIIAGCLLVLAANFVMFYIYGSVPFLYSSVSTFSAVTALALTADQETRLNPRAAIWILPAVGVFALLLALNNFGFIYGAYAVFRDLPPGRWR